MEIVSLEDGYIILKLDSMDVSNINNTFSKEIEETNVYSPNDATKIARRDRMKSFLDTLLPYFPQITASNPVDDRGPTH